MANNSVQTTIRLPKGLLERINRQARKEHRSFNNFVAHTLDKATELVFPKLGPEDLIISDEINGLSAGILSRGTSPLLLMSPESFIERMR